MKGLYRAVSVVALCLVTTFGTALLAIRLMRWLIGYTEATSPGIPGMVAVCIGMIVGSAIGIVAGRELFRER